MTSATSRRPLSDQEARDPVNKGAGPPEAADALNEGGRASTPGPHAAHSTGAFAAPDYERLRALAALYEQPQRAKHRSVYRTVLMLLIFALGAGVGLAATWWFSGAGKIPLSPTLSKPLSTVSASGDNHSASSARSGISASELPYDGRKPFANGMAPSVPALNPSELPYSGQSDDDKDSRVEVDAGKARRADKPRRTATEQAGLSERAEERGKEQLQVAPHKASRSRSTARRMKDREIERIRQQADEELKKKSERSRTLNEARARSRLPPSNAAAKDGRRHDSRNPSHLRPKLAKCARADNLIRREQCKWRLCSGMWGKNGCPSYAHAKPY